MNKHGLMSHLCTPNTYLSTINVLLLLLGTPNSNSSRDEGNPHQQPNRHQQPYITTYASTHNMVIDGLQQPSETTSIHNQHMKEEVNSLSKL